MKRAWKNQPFIYFTVLAYGFTWIGSLIYFFTLPRNGQVLPPGLGLPGAVFWYFGPFLAALIVTRTREGRPGIRRLLMRLLDWRVGARWYAFLIFYPLFLHAAVVYLDHLLGGPGPVFFQAEGVAAGNKWLTLLALVVYHTLVRGIGEETGWRGFALPWLQSRMNSRSASLALGLLWGVWHFHPANFFTLVSTEGIFIFLNIVATTFIFTWLYNHTKGSLFVAALFHMTLNVAEFVLPIGIANAGPTRHILQIGLIVLTAAGLWMFSSRPAAETDPARSVGTV